MANQEILYKLWLENNMPEKGVAFKEIGEFADINKSSLKSKSGQITPSGLDYAVLKFILGYCSPSNWTGGLWEEFEKAKRPSNYAIWRKHPNLRIDIVEKQRGGISIPPKTGYIREIIPSHTGTFVSKSKFLNRKMMIFVDFLIKKIERGTLLGKRGWLEQLRSYRWPPGKGSLGEGINLRKHFSSLVNCAVNSTGRGSGTFRYGMCNAVAGWGGLPQVSGEDCSEIFNSIDYLKTAVNKDLFDCNKIFARRIALASKLYYFSDPLNWTIYDSRVALTFSQLVYLFEKEERDIFNRLKNEISFPLPPTPSKIRKHPFCIKWDKTEASLWFVRASILLKAIAECLNGEGFLPLPEVISSSHLWELYHVEMVFFRLGERNWANRISTSHNSG